jgi:hypothetical protein
MNKRNFENERTTVEAVDINGEERFVIVVIDGRSPGMRTTKPLTEAKFKDHLRSGGMPGHNIGATITAARGRRNAHVLTCRP